ncbi:UPF0481 protein [Prunus yedoensis var. nudiflora]|uniref:UPF0481 protein n=1 Tax=Prunus yedoensis var. nudiflora TaxID=2094558 RepID=A0A314YWT6_PRUYE|nr:UPF0481 protein [Prunus yedoensis var. nudiflora]
MANDIESSKDHTSIVVEDNLLEELKESMRGKLGPDRSPLPSTCCIFKVPQVLRRHNPKAYINLTLSPSDPFIDTVNNSNAWKL